MKRFMVLLTPTALAALALSALLATTPAPAQPPLKSPLRGGVAGPVIDPTPNVKWQVCFVWEEGINDPTGVRSAGWFSTTINFNQWEYYVANYQATYHVEAGDTCPRGIDYLPNAYQ